MTFINGGDAAHHRGMDFDDLLELDHAVSQYSRSTR
jgi:hypothetical protein